MWNKERQEFLNSKLTEMIGEDTVLSKGAYFTDIHFGRRSNCTVHNNDCLEFIEFFCNEVRADSSIDHVVFLGDWHENRTNLDLNTLNYSREGMRMLNDLGIPVFHLVGNHDMRYITSREIHSVPHFNEFGNVIVIDEPTLFEQFEGGAFMCPYIFPEEYAFLSSNLSKEQVGTAKTWLGHFEFKGFKITGGNTVMKSGPSIEDFSGPTKIFSGHFHRRQSQRNTHYIGNAFPMDFGDAGDFERGLAIYDYKKDDLSFIDWEEAPRYIRINLSQLQEGGVELFEKARVECMCDVAISFEDSISIKDIMMETHKLRDFILIDDLFIKETISGEMLTEDIKSEDGVEFGTIDEMVVSMLAGIENEAIDNNLLIEIYKDVKVD